LVGDERFRRFFNIQVMKLKKVAAVGSLFLLVFNLSLLLYPYIEHRDVHPYVAIPVVFVFIGFVILVFAHVYLRVFDMYRTEAAAERTLDPYMIYAFSPIGEMMLRCVYLPVLYGLYNLSDDGVDKYKMKGFVDVVENWVSLGFIPKEDFPEHLKRFYVTNKRKRL